MESPGGKKVCRYACLFAVDKNGNKHYFQIGRTNKTGIPNTISGAVKRERIAIEDMVKYGGILIENIHFITYNK